MISALLNKIISYSKIELEHGKSFNYLRQNLTHNQRVGGSSPFGPTKKNSISVNRVFCFKYII